MEEVNRLRFLAPEKIFLILDCCFSGGTDKGVKSITPVVGSRIKGMPGEITGGFAGSVEGKGRVLFASSKDFQVSLESEELRHGIFTYFLLEALSANKNRLADINKHVYDKVRNYTKAAQEPNLDISEQEGDLNLF